MDKKEMIALAERIACKHRKFSADEVKDRCMAIMHAVAAMEDLLETPPMKQWIHAPSEMVNCRCVMPPVNPFEIGGVVTEVPPMPGTELLWRGDGIAGLTIKAWREDEVVEISAGMTDVRWRGTIQEVRDGKFPHNHQGFNKWRFLKVEAEWWPCIGSYMRPPSWADADDSSMLCHYGDSGGGTYRVERLADVNWRTVLAVKRVLE